MFALHHFVYDEAQIVPDIGAIYILRKNSEEDVQSSVNNAKKM